MKNILILLTLFLFSCSTVKKLKTSSHLKVDSSVIANSHVQANVKQDSTSFKISDENYQTKLSIVFDSVREEAQPFVAGKLPFVPTLHTIKIDGKEISSTQRMKSLIVTLSGQTSIIDLTKNIKSDSTITDSNKAVTVNKVEDKKSRSVERKGVKVLIWLGLFLIIAGGVFVYFKYFKK